MNKVILMGRLTRDPESRYTQANSSQESMCVARYTLAVDRKGSRSEGQQSADFIPCVAFGRAGEFAEKYFRKRKKTHSSSRIWTRNCIKTSSRRRSCSHDYNYSKRNGWRIYYV